MAGWRRQRQERKVQPAAQTGRPANICEGLSAGPGPESGVPNYIESKSKSQQWQPRDAGRTGRQRQRQRQQNCSIILIIFKIAFNTSWQGVVLRAPLPRSCLGYLRRWASREQFYVGCCPLGKYARFVRRQVGGEGMRGFPRRRRDFCDNILR